MLFDGILETSTTTGTGDVTMSAQTGRLRFTDFFTANATEASADLFYYAITTQDSPPQFLEIGVGYCSAAGTLKRVKPIATFVSGVLTHFPGTAAVLPAGTKNIICTADAASFAPGLGDVAPIGGSYGLRLIGPPHLVVAASGAGLTKDRLHYTPIYLNSAQKVSSLKIAGGGTIGVGGTRGFRLGLYSALKNGMPGRLLIESADMSVAAYGIASSSFTAQRLAPGWYYGAVCHDYGTTAQTFYLSGGTSLLACGNTPLGWSNAAGLSPIPAVYETLSASWASLPANASGTLTPMTTGGVPMVCLGLA